ncbi:aldo/keto reductase [Deinococcus cellulosilyticus]|uniref:Oxidoreductase n=1 Tax=Deinococcus cellulosilyticus (strain DSM 18568 / NBRC 106333 / KACC 11606 / 5516J-15) TaxID=1223518 RepID=A0A511NAZ4_DEIC1|nr:aldo/keto reductase [Deinococcus cellulosilyticus]GEM49688.1 oxidoreductase [Deinococcus cellulosilyticus NBRC 106333 = KACC 11606]
MKRKIGTREVSALGMGCWAIGGEWFAGTQPLGWGKVDDQESIRALHAALELGITLYDTADIYGCGHSERILGEAFGGRDDIFIATKFGNVPDEATKQVLGEDTSPEYIVQACEASLKRLRREHIDLYQLHINFHDLDTSFRIAETLERLAEEGKIRAFGWSTDDPERAKAWKQYPHYQAVQHSLNVMQSTPEMLKVCEELDLASINRGPLAMGLLTGKFSAGHQLSDTDIRAKSPDWMVASGWFEHGKPGKAFLKRLESVREVLASDGRTLGQGALAWIWATSEKTIPIPGFRTVKQVQENAGALQYGPLRAEQLQEVERLLGRA